MSHPVQIPADVTREDVLIGRLTARQLAAAAVTAALIYLQWRLLGPGRVGWFALAAVPVALLGVVVVFGRRDGVALDVFAWAALRQWAALRGLPREPITDRSTSGRWGFARRPVRVGLLVRGVHPVGSDGVGVLDLGRDGAAVVCAVAPVNLSLRSPDEQDAVVAGFARWLHSLSAPVQILTRTQPLNLSGPLQRLHQAAPYLGNDALSGAAYDHAAHLAAMGEHADLLHHEFLIVFRDPTPLPKSPPQPAHPPAWSRSRGVGVGVGVAGTAYRAAAETLRRRAAEAAALLSPLGLRVTPLDAAQAALVLNSATAPTTGPRPTRTGVTPSGGSWDAPELAGYDSGAPLTDQLPIVTGRPGWSQPGLPQPGSSERGCDPGPVLVGSRRIGRSGVWSATLVVTGYPREVSGAGWLTPLTGHPGLVDVSLHITPVPATLAAGQLRRQLARLESARRSTATHDRLPDPDVDAAAADAHVLAERVARGETKLFTTTLTVTVTAADEADLDAELGAVRALLASLLITSHPATGRAWHAWLSGLPLGRDLIGTGRVLDTTALAAAFPFASPDLPPPGTHPTSPDTTGAAVERAGGEVLLGYNLASSSLVFWDRWARDNYNTVILGRSGAGKSYLTKLELLRSLYTGVQAHVIDPEDEYVRLAQAVDATVVAVGAPGVRINPLDLDIHTDPHGHRSAAPDSLARRRLTLHSFLALALTTTDTHLHSGAGTGGSPGAGGAVSAAERAVLDEAITRTYAHAGITADPATWTRPAPLLRDLYAALTNTPPPTDNAQPGAAPPQGVEPAAGLVPSRIARALDPASGQPAAPHDTTRTTTTTTTTTAMAAAVAAGGARGGLAQDLAQRLRPYVDGAFAGLFDGPTTHPPEGRHLVVWSLRALPEQLRSLATMLVLDTIWRTVTHPHDRRRRMVVVDEAWLLLQHPAGAAFLLRAAKAGRKHWCGLTVATQDTADVLASDLGRAVIANSATQILLRQAPQAIDQVARVFGLSAGERALLLTAERGEGLLTGGEHRAGFAALASAQEDRLITTDPAQHAPSTEQSWIALDPPPAQAAQRVSHATASGTPSTSRPAAVTW